MFSPVLHGLYGEDGTVQGILELAKIPYVGCGVLASAVSMDKLSTKVVVGKLGIRQASYVPVMKEELDDLEAVVNRDGAGVPVSGFCKAVQCRVLPRRYPRGFQGNVKRGTFGGGPS